MMTEDQQGKPITDGTLDRRGGVYLLPHIFTTASIFAGFYSVLQSIGGDFQKAAIAIMVGMLLDACDGYVARATNTQSKFGVEYDSLADVITFGMAPALLLYQWALSGLGRIGIGVAFLYCAAAAIRLARFNVNVQDKRFFVGLPCPGAALWISSFVCIVLDLKDIPAPLISWGTAVSLLILAFSMISKNRFLSFKSRDMKSRISYHYQLIFLLVAALLIMFVEDYFFEIIFSGITLYILGGYIWRFRSTIALNMKKRNDKNLE